MVRCVVFVVAIGLVAACSAPKTPNIPEIGSTTFPAQASAQWPWEKSSYETVASGVERWYLKDLTGTALELLCFDLSKGLVLKLIDQDALDDKPFDNSTNYYSQSAAHIMRQLQQDGCDPVAVWNGSFFGYDRRPGVPQDTAVHVGPMVIGNKAYYNLPLVRWTFGFKSSPDGLKLNVTQTPFSELGEKFDFACNGVECLILEGKPLPLIGGKTPTKEQAGSIQGVDQMRTSRTSVGWSKDSRYLYLLVVSEPDTETESKLASRHGGEDTGGWTVADLQRFWTSYKANFAVNLDGGVVTQLVLNRNGRMEMVPPKLTVNSQRITLNDDISDAPQGGSIMYFAICRK